MLDALIFNMPVEASLKFMPAIGSDGADPEERLLDDVVHELDGAILVVFREDL